MNTTQEIIQAENWREVKGMPEIFVSDKGNIRSQKYKIRLYVNPKGYVVANINRKLYTLHRLIALTFIDRTDSNLVVDHINHNKEDNRVVNLRWCTVQENNRHTRKTNKKCTSQYKGVCYDKETNKWIAKIGLNYGRIYIGRYDSEEKAYEEYCKKAKELFGQFYC